MWPIFWLEHFLHLFYPSFFQLCCSCIRRARLHLKLLGLFSNSNLLIFFLLSMPRGYLYTFLLLKFFLSYLSELIVLSFQKFYLHLVLSESLFHFFHIGVFFFKLHCLICKLHWVNLLHMKRNHIRAWERKIIWVIYLSMMRWYCVWGTWVMLTHHLQWWFIKGD